MQSRARERAAVAIQFSLVCVYGVAAFVALWPYPENPKVPLLGGLIAGIGGLHLTMFCVVWVRHGWQAARTIRLSD